MSKTYTETDIANLMNRFNTGTGTDVAPESRPVVRAPRETPVTVPLSGYRVTIGGSVHGFTVDAPTAGVAVLVALATAKAEGIAGIGAAVFMWGYTVTDSEGVTLSGSDRTMRDSLESARINAWRSR